MFGKFKVISLLLFTPGQSELREISHLIKQGESGSEDYSPSLLFRLLALSLLPTMNWSPYNMLLKINQVISDINPM